MGLVVIHDIHDIYDTQGHSLHGAISNAAVVRVMVGTIVVGPAFPL